MTAQSFLKRLLLGVIIVKLCVGITEAEEPSEIELPSRVSSGSRVGLIPLDASPFTGEAATAFPIELPVSSGNMQNKLNVELRYRSAGNNSWVGKGWELDVGSIAKVNKYGAESPNNPYMLTLNGQSDELVAIATNQYRTKNESFKKIEFNNTLWQVWEKDGTLYKFETSSGGRWVLTKITNTHGLSIVLVYDQPNNKEIYLKEIRYPEGQGLTAYCKISFITETKPDPLVSFYTGVESQSKKRLKEIQILVSNVLQKRYALTYTTNATSLVSLLSSIQEYGKNGSNLPATSFSYQQPSRTGLFPSTESLVSNNSDFFLRQPSKDNESGQGTIGEGAEALIIDLNNDGLPDLITNRDVNLYTGYNIEVGDWVVYLNTGSGISNQGSIWLSASKSWFKKNSQYAEPISLTRNSVLIDMNQDNLPDLVYSKYGGQIRESLGSYKYVYDVFVRYNLGNKFSDQETKLLDNQSAYFSFENFIYPIKLGDNASIIDINGDGLPDLVYDKWKGKEGIGVGTYWLLSEWAVRLNTGTSFSTSDKTWLDFSKSYFKYALPNSGNQLERIDLKNNSTLADMNGDGLVDLVYTVYSGYLVDKNYNYVPRYTFNVRYNTGSKFSDEVVVYYKNAPAYFFEGPNSTALKRISVKLGVNGTLADINNDGLLDLVFNSYSNLNGSLFVEWKFLPNLGNKFSGTALNLISTTKTLNSIMYQYYTDPS